MSVDLEKAFDAFCARNVSCLGRRDRGLCYWMDSAIFEGREKHFFASFPVIALHTPQGNALRWYPSEYFYAVESKGGEKLYCMAKENYGRSTELLLGGSFMRQNNFEFNTEDEELAYSRARCSHDEQMLLGLDEMGSAQFVEQHQLELDTVKKPAVRPDAAPWGVYLLSGLLVLCLLLICILMLKGSGQSRGARDVYP